MQLSSRGSLTFQQARNTVAVGLMLGLLLSSVQLTLDFIKERGRINTTVSQITVAVREQAAQAAYNVNSSLALKVINGLFEYEPICEARLVDDFGTTLASRRRSPASGRMDWLVRRIFGDDITYSLPLFREDGKTPLGNVRITLDSYLIGLNFFERAEALILGNVFLSFVLACVLALITYYSITKPLLKVAQGLSSVDTTKPAEASLDVPPGHESDEMGLLVDAANRLLEGFEDSLARYRTLVETMNEGLAVFDLSGKLTYVNEKLCRILGYAGDEMNGCNISDFMDSPRNTPSAGQAGWPGKEAETSSEVRYIRKDGSIITTIMSPRAIYDKKGRHIGTFAVITDITDRKKVEQALEVSERKYRSMFEALRESEERFKSSFEHAASGMALVATNGRFLQVNRALCEIMGYSEEELLRKTWMDITNPQDLETSIAGLRKIEEGSEGAHLEKRYIHREGHEIWAIESTSLVCSEQSDPLYFISQFQDISQRVLAEREKSELEAQLRQSLKMEAVGRLAGGVAHDFNNMLGVIIGHTELAMEQVDSLDDLYHDLREIYKAALRSAALSRQLLAFARKQTVSPKILDLNDTVSGMIGMLRRLIGEDIDLAWKPSDDLWKVKIDPSQVDQMLANLAVNARDAIAGVGRVIIETSNVTLDDSYCALHTGFVPGGYVMLTVSDTGSGMGRDVLDHVFEPFFTTKEVGKGTGLGLATVYGIVKQNNGFVNVYSELGHGTTFTIYLPRFEGETAPAPTPVPLEDLRGNGETVLIVEDEEAILDLGKTILDRLGYMVLTANTPDEAISVASDHDGDIHLLVTDVVMPDMNGRELLEQLIHLKPQLKCLYMSGYPANVVAHHGVLHEGVNFIQKPFSVKSMAQKVRDVLVDT